MGKPTKGFQAGAGGGGRRWVQAGFTFEKMALALEWGMDGSGWGEAECYCHRLEMMMAGMIT